MGVCTDPAANDSFPWPWTDADDSQTCNVVPSLTRNAFDNVFGYVELALVVALALAFLWYIILCLVLCCAVGKDQDRPAKDSCYEGTVTGCQRMWGCCGFASFNYNCCRATAHSQGCQGMAVVQGLIVIVLWASLYIPPLWNGTWGFCGLWHWELLKLVYYIARSLFFCILCWWFFYELDGSCCPGSSARRQRVRNTKADVENDIDGDDDDDDDDDDDETVELMLEVMDPVDDLRAWAALATVALVFMVALNVGVAISGSQSPACRDSVFQDPSDFSFENPCDTISIAQIFIEALSGLALWAAGRRALTDQALPQRLQPLALSLLLFGICEVIYAVVDVAHLGLSSVWQYEFEALIPLVLTFSPLVHMVVRIFFKCTTPMVKRGSVDPKARQRGKQCCQCAQHGVFFIVLIVICSLALAAASGAYPCRDDTEIFLVNYSREANFTPAEEQLGIGVFLSRFGKGPIGFIVFLISVSMYFGVVAFAEKSFFRSFLPRVTGSLTALHSMLAALLWIFMILHIVGHTTGLAAYFRFTETEKSHLGPIARQYFEGFDFSGPGVAMPWSYWSGIIATLLMATLSIGGVIAMSKDSMFPCCCCRCSSKSQTCSVYSWHFRMVHRCCALAVVIILALHSVEAKLGPWQMWLWMVLLLLFFVAEFGGFQGWCICWKPCRTCRPVSLILCSLKHRAHILRLEHELAPERRRKRGGDGGSGKGGDANDDKDEPGWTIKPPVMITFECHGFRPKVGEYCFLGIAERGRKHCSRTVEGATFHPYTVFSLRNPNQYALYVHTGFRPRSLQEGLPPPWIEPARGGWTYQHFMEGVAQKRFASRAEYEERAQALVDTLANKAIYVVGGFVSELAQPSFCYRQRIFCTCAGAGVTPFLSLAGDVSKRPERYRGKIITVVRSATHELIPKWLCTQFDFVEKSVETLLQGDPGDVALAKLMQALTNRSGKMTCHTFFHRFNNGDTVVFRFLQGYINVGQALTSALAHAEAGDYEEMRNVFRSVYYGEPSKFDEWIGAWVGDGPDDHVAALKAVTDRKLSTQERDERMPSVELMRPVVKLANIFGRRPSGCPKSEFVSFGHCGNGDRVEFYSDSYQKHIRAHGDGQCAIESFD